MDEMRIRTIAIVVAAIAVTGCGGPAAVSSNTPVPPAAAISAPPQGAISPVSILNKIQGIHLMPGETDMTNANGIRYAQGEMGTPKQFRWSNADEITVYAGGTPAQLKDAMRGSGTPSWYIIGDGWTLHYRVTTLTGKPFTSISEIQQEVGGRIVSTP